MRIELGDITVYLGRIEREPGDSRAEAERKSVAALVEEAFGSGAEITHDATGRPLIPGASISVSHSRTLCALATGPEGIGVGVDVEDTGERPLRVIGRVARGEFADDYAADAVMALKGWTLLEASFKCTTPNEGLTLVDFRLPDPSGGLEGKFISLDGRPEVRLRILACRSIDSGKSWMSVVEQDQSFVP